MPYVLLIGIGIGTANYIINGELNWLQWVVQSLSTSFLIGYTLVVVAANKAWFNHHLKPFWKLYLLLFGGFFTIGVIATAVEHVIRTTVFSNTMFQPLAEGKMYVFNGIISLVLGFSFFQNKQIFPGEDANAEQDLNTFPEQENELDLESTSIDPILKLPVKQGETIVLIPVQDIVYLEAFDNYAFVYDLQGKKRLCDYSLRFLQKRLGKLFLRVHRKYILNTTHIKEIKPDSNARYRILFNVPELSPIVSSKSYAAVIRSLIKIK